MHQAVHSFSFRLSASCSGLPRRVASQVIFTVSCRSGCSRSSNWFGHCFRLLKSERPSPRQALPTRRRSLVGVLPLRIVALARRSCVHAPPRPFPSPIVQHYAAPQQSRPYSCSWTTRSGAWRLALVFLIVAPVIFIVCSVSPQRRLSTCLFVCFAHCLHDPSSLCLSLASDHL